MNCTNYGKKYMVYLYIYDEMSLTLDKIVFYKTVTKRDIIKTIIKVYLANFYYFFNNISCNKS